MKKYALALLLVMLAVLTAFPASALIEAEPVPFPEYGDRLENAKEIEVGVYYLRDYVASWDAWVCFTAEESGVYTFYLHTIDQGGFFRICNRYGKAYHRLPADQKEPHVLVAIELNAGTTYYINCYTPISGQRNFFYGICSPTHHVVLGDEYYKQEPSCTEPGLVCAVCELCQREVNIRTVEPVDHTPGELTVTTPSTCIALGEAGTFCTVCNEQLSTEIVPMGDHVLGEMQLVRAATCTEEASAE